MPYSIRKVGSQYCLYLKDSGKKLGCHKTKAGAEAQRRAIEMRKHAAAKQSVIFLDIDGVLNTEPQLPADQHGPEHLNPELIGRLQSLVASTGAKIVVSSSWRHKFSAEEIGQMLASGYPGLDAAVIDATAGDGEESRGQRILDWLQAHPDVGPYVILDDSPMGNGQDQVGSHWVQVDPRTGLTDENIQAAETILGNEKPKAASRNLILRIATGAAEMRTATFDGKERIVLPVVGLVEGVIWPINAEHPEFVPADTISLIPQGWNGRPVFASLGHPLNEDGEQVSGNSPDHLEDSIGMVFNAHSDGKRLLMEAWLDPTKPEAQKVIARVNAGHPIEVSVGAFVIEESAKGTFGGKRYDSIWREIIPDHLAILPEGDEGACSVAMGCGIRTAKVHTLSSEGQVSYEPQGPAEYKSMVESLGPEFLQAHLFTHCMDVIIPAIEKKGGKVDDPNAFCGWWKQENSMANPKAMSAFAERVSKSLKNIDVLKELHAFGDGVAVYETAAGKMYRQDYAVANTGEITFGKERVEVEPVMYYEPVDVKAAKGARHSAADMAKIQAMHDHTVELGATCVGAPKAASAHPCGCGNNSEEEIVMKNRTKEQREELVKALRAKLCPKLVTRLDALKGSSGDLIDAIISGIKDKLKLSDAAAEDLANLDESTLVELAGMSVPDAKPEGAEGDGNNKDGKEPPAPPAPPAAPVAAAAKTPQTEEEFLAAAPESIRNLVADAKAKEAARVTDLVKVLKGAQSEYTEDELKAKPVKELERLVRALKVNTPKVDFGVNAPKGSEEEGDAPKPINIEDRIKAARSKK